MAVALSSCSQPTGMEQLDRANGEARRVLGIGHDLDGVGDAAVGAVRDAEAAGRSGDPARMADAVGSGTARVLCAGTGARKGAARQTLRTIDQRAPDIDGRKAAVDLYRGVVDAIPDVPNPCG